MSQYAYVAYDKDQKTFQVWNYETQEQAINAAIEDARNGGLAAESVSHLVSLYMREIAYEDDGYVTTVVRTLTGQVS